MSFNPSNFKNDRHVCLNCEHFSTETGYAECHNNDNYIVGSELAYSDSRGDVDLYDVCDNWESET